MTELYTRFYRSSVDPMYTLGMILHVQKDFLPEMPTELRLEGFVERIILEMGKKKIPGRRNGVGRGTVRTVKRLIKSWLPTSLYTSKQIKIQVQHKFGSESSLGLTGKRDSCYGGNFRENVLRVSKISRLLIVRGQFKNEGYLENCHNERE